MQFGFGDNNARCSENLRMVLESGNSVARGIHDDGFLDDSAVLRRRQTHASIRPVKEDKYFVYRSFDAATIV